MKFTELAVLLPCHSLEDFPIYHEGDEADELLSAWCALWHPALIASAAALPHWHRIDVPPEDFAGRLICLPPFCEPQLPTGYLDRAVGEGGWVVQQSGRDAALAQALAGLDGGDAGVDAELAADFLALGFCRLQMELLTRQMRYTSNIDEDHFAREAVAAAQAAVAGDEATARDHLQQCFDTLYESRKHFYPVEVYLLDITLLAATTLGPELESELARRSPANFLATTDVLDQLVRDHPAAWSQLLAGIDAETALVVGGEPQEGELPLLPLEAALASLLAGNHRYEALLGRRPMIYGRRRAGLSPTLVQLLARLDYQGALHFTLDDGRFPLGPQSKIRWEGLDMSVIDAFARVPGDAARPESMLGLSRSLSDSMDTDHVATATFAHWPGRTSPWYDDLRRVARHSPVLGKFVLLDDYFLHTDIPGRISKFTADEYRTPYLKQTIIQRQSDPLSRIASVHRDQAARSALSAATTVCDLISGHSVPEPADASASLAARLSAAAARLASLLPRADAPASPRRLVFNPAVYGRRMYLELPAGENPPRVAGPVVAAATSGARSFAVVDVPALGFAWIEPAETAWQPASREKPLAEENVLRNEFFEVKISRTTGAIQALYNYRQRGNQLSQQIAFRLSGQGRYTTMRAETVEITAACPAYGEITSTGSLVDDEGTRWADFRQTTGVWAGSRLIHLAIELSNLEDPRADPWNSYYAARFAWPDETAQLSRGVSLAQQTTEAGRLEAPEFVVVDNGAATVSILTGGLPYHRRSDPRMLDTLLVVRGETARRFELALGVDLPQPAAAALEHLTPAVLHDEVAPPGRGATGWFFHAGAKNVVATHWQPIVDDSSEASPETGRPAVGFQARLLEVGGTAGRVPLHAFRPVGKARQLDFLGETILELFVDNDKIMLDFGAHEFLEVAARWKTEGPSSA